MAFMTFPSYWECHHPNWRTHLFQRGRYTTNQVRFLTHYCFWTESTALSFEHKFNFLTLFGTLCRKKTYLHSYMWDENSQPLIFCTWFFQPPTRKWRLFNFNMKNMSHMPFFLSINNPTMVDYGTSSLWNSWRSKNHCRDPTSPNFRTVCE